MPLPMKTLKEAAMELGIPEHELKAMASMSKIRAVMRKGALCIAPDELAKIKRLRKTNLDSAGPTPPKPAPPPKTPAGPAKASAAGPRAAAGSAGAAAPKPATPRPTITKPVGLKLPEPPPQ